MTTGEFYLELKGWQTVLGSILGFLALIGGALFNYHLNRRRDDRLREQEALSVALALYGEMDRLSWDLSKMANGIGGWYMRNGAQGGSLPSHMSTSYVLPEPLLYKALAPKLGLLRWNHLIPIVRFYSRYSEAIAHYPKMFEDESRKVTYGVEWVLEPAVNAIDSIFHTMIEIGDLAKVSDPAITPNLDTARKAIELEADMRPD